MTPTEIILISVIFVLFAIVVLFLRKEDDTLAKMIIADVDAATQQYDSGKSGQKPNLSKISAYVSRLVRAEYGFEVNCRANRLVARRFINKTLAKEFPSLRKIDAARIVNMCVYAVFLKDSMEVALDEASSTKVWRERVVPSSIFA